MTNTKSLPELVGEIYPLLEPLESQDRLRVLNSVMTLLGEKSGALSAKENSGSGHDDNADELSFGPKATRWMEKNGISTAAIEEIFHCEGDDVKIIASEVPGNGKKGKTHNCYLLSGIRSLLATDEAKFSETEAVDFCKYIGCHDSPNHAKIRGELGNWVAGTKTSGFTLPAPGLRAAAELIKTMSSN